MNPLLRPIIALVALTGLKLTAQTATLPVVAAAADSDAGFVSMFDGSSLNGWDGDPKYWRVETGVIVG